MPVYCRSPDDLFDIFTTATIIFCHNPHELGGVVIAHLEQRATGVVDFTAIIKRSLGAVFCQVSRAQTQTLWRKKGETVFET
jgi:hypothetical protein